MYHTQEDRGERKLVCPMLCDRKDAWFGEAYYFWWDRGDAVRWGETSKKGKYDIYSAMIKSERVLDTVFNSEHYDFWWNCMAKLAKNCIEKTGQKPTARDIAEYLNNRAGWKDEIDVLLACDMPTGEKELFSRHPVRKRIQAAVYNRDVIFCFTLDD